MSKNLRMFFVVNPKSGHGRGWRIWENIRHKIKQRFGSCDSALTEAKGHGIILTTEALREGYEMIVAVGGDGTVNEVVNGFFDEGKVVSERAVLGIIPAGTGGDYVKSFQYPRLIKDQIHWLAGRKTRLVDLGHVSFRTIDGMEQNRYFANIAGCGLPGVLVDRISKMPRTYGGKAAYFMGLISALKHYQNQTILVTVDGSDVVERKALCGVVANGQYFGSGMHIAADAELDDGWLDFVLVGDVSLWELMRNIPNLYSGNLKSHPKIDVYRAKDIRIESKERVLLDLDGEQTGVLPAHYTILPKALRVKVR